MPMYGFKTKEEYYKACTLAGKWNKITVPTFCLSADDDMMIDARFAPYKEAQAPGSKMLLAQTKIGGHVGHVTGKLFPYLWYPVPFLEFFNFLKVYNKRE
jgi:uncharacterized protein